MGGLQGGLGWAVGGCLRRVGWRLSFEGWVGAGLSAAHLCGRTNTGFKFMVVDVEEKERHQENRLRGVFIKFLWLFSEFQVLLQRLISTPPFLTLVSLRDLFQLL